MARYSDKRHAPSRRNDEARGTCPGLRKLYGAAPPSRGVRPQPPRAPPQVVQAGRLELARPLAADAELLPDLPQRVRPPTLEPEAQPQHGALRRLERIERGEDR